MVQLKYSFDSKEVIIVPLADLHVGDEMCDITELKKVLKYIETTPNAYTVLNGDILNVAIKSSVSFEHGASSVDSELDKAVSLFKPIADKILMLTEGNHEVRVKKTVGMDLLKVLSQRLGIEDRYVGVDGLLNVKTSYNEHRNKSFRMFFNHGTGVGGGRTMGAKANGIKRLADKIINCDLYCMGHVHTPMHYTDVIVYNDDKHYNNKQLTRHFVITPAYMLYGGYGQAFNYAPPSTQQYAIHLTDDLIVSTINFK